MKIVIYKNGLLIERMTAKHLDVSAKVLTIYEAVTSKGEKKEFFYCGNIYFTIVSDVATMDIFEPDETNPEKLNHIRINAFDW